MLRHFFYNYTVDKIPLCVPSIPKLSFKNLHQFFAEFHKSPYNATNYRYAVFVISVELLNMRTV